MNNRNSSIELLRIIGMLMIVTIHYIGPFTTLEKTELINYNMIHLLESFAIIGVNIFVIISSHFLIKKGKIKIRKIINLLSITIFYGVTFFIISIVFNIREFSYKELLLAVIPFLGGRRWFVLSYIVLYLLCPYLSKLLNSISKEEYKKLIIIVLLFMSIWPSFFPGGLNLDNGYGITSFIMIFILTGYITRFCTDFNYNKYLYIVIAMLCQMIIYAQSLIKINNSYWNYNNIFNIFSAISLFLFFKNLTIHSNFINKLSSCAFSVFLIHSDYYMSTFFYEKLMNRANVIVSSKLIIYIVIYTFLTYIFCSIIEQIRILFFKCSIDRFLDRVKVFNKEIECK